MKAIICPRCGADGFKTKDGYTVCAYCGSKLVLNNDEHPQVSTTISILEDVAVLLEKCKSDPQNAVRYANLALDIDPSNKDALQYLSKGR